MSSFLLLIQPGVRFASSLVDKGEGQQFSRPGRAGLSVCCRHLVDRRVIRVQGGHGGPGNRGYKKHTKPLGADPLT